MSPLARLLKLWPPIGDGLTRSLFILYCPSMHRSWKRVPAIEARLSGGVAAAEPADLHSSRCRQPLETSRRLLGRDELSLSATSRKVLVALSATFSN